MLPFAQYLLVPLSVNILLQSTLILPDFPFRRPVHQIIWSQCVGGLKPPMVIFPKNKQILNNTCIDIYMCVFRQNASGRNVLQICSKSSTDFLSVKPFFDVIVNNKFHTFKNNSLFTRLYCLEFIFSTVFFYAFLCHIIYFQAGFLDKVKSKYTGMVDLLQ